MFYVDPSGSVLVSVPSQNVFRFLPRVPDISSLDCGPDTES